MGAHRARIVTDGIAELYLGTKILRVVLEMAHPYANGWLSGLLDDDWRNNDHREGLHNRGEDSNVVRSRVRTIGAPDTRGSL